MAAIKPDYNVGTVSLAAGGTTITGVDTFWDSSTIQAGDTLMVQNLSAIIAEVTDNNHIELVEAWTGDALVAAPYRIRFQSGDSRYTAAVRDLIVELGNGNIQAFAALAGALDMIPIFTGTGALTLIPKTELIEGVQTDAKVENLAGRGAYDAEVTGFSVLVADVGDGRSAIYFKITSSSGDWSDPAYLTGPNGSFQSKGTYSGATVYVVGDVVLQNGSSWIARVNTTGNPPPTLPSTSNTQWFLLSAAGNGFVFKGAYSGATAYIKDDVVLYNNSSWIALLATTGNTPPALPTTSNTQWSLLAARGAGDMIGPGSSVTDNILTFTDATGKVAKDSTIPINHAIKMRNLIVNPAFQESLVAGPTPFNISGVYYADQWVGQWGVASQVITGQWIENSPTPGGATNRLRVTVSTGGAVAAGHYMMIRQPFEGLRIASLRMGTAGAKRSIVRFGFKGPAGTYGVTFANAAASRNYITTFTISAPQANTDTLQTFLIPGDTAGTWPSTNAYAMTLNIVMAAGTTFQGAANTWQAGNLLGTATMTNVMTTGHVFELFDVGLYCDEQLIGIPPKFEIPSEILNQVECMRYIEYLGMTLVSISDLPAIYMNTAFYKTKKRTTSVFTLLVGSLGSATLGPLGADATNGLRQLTTRATAADILISADSRMI
ncbi:hypothetical protein J2X72_001116 [Phyllobacterium sp. 1468]|uniref:hypothetical protein n=1 Tax=Phyllobacterium sp. 1468 TaxID=2817759 RepID=UPI002866004B|nr:hypothetical protein [Phyllobacterium sp. 1468]MDR6632332.1 hypothetical protein [Phyllobacterium sp. 1468]